MESAEKLYNYLDLKLQSSINFEDLNNLCYSLFCTIDFLPENIKTLKITKEVLSRTFSKIVEKKYNSDKNEKYWIEYIDESLKLGRSPNLENARILLGTS